MQAVIARAFGTPETFKLEPVSQKAIGAGEVRVSIRAAGVSFVDALIAAGKYQIKPSLPFTPGSEFSGVIEAVGSDVSSFQAGARICGSTLCGAFAESITIPAQTIASIPASMSFEEAAVFRVSYATAYHGLVQRAALISGETVLVLGAAGAIGIASIQLAKALGARVIACVSSAEKRAMAASNGADIVLDANSPNWQPQIEALTGGRGVEVVVDPLGGVQSEQAFRCLGWEGRHLIVGFASGQISRMPMNLPLLKGSALLGVNLYEFNRNQPETANNNFARLLELYDAGALRPAIGATFPLERFVEAMRAVSQRSIAGRVVLTTS